MSKPKLFKDELSVRRCYRYRGVNVIIEIDYLSKEISVVSYNHNQRGYYPKQFVFAKRGLEYMAGWQLILDAIKAAVADATQELEEVKKKDLLKIVEAYKNLSEVKK